MAVQIETASAGVLESGVDERSRVSGSDVAKPAGGKGIYAWRGGSKAYSVGANVGGRQWILVTNRTGGQGKSLVAEIILSALPSERVVIAADSTAAAGAQQRSKLGRLFPEVEELGCGPSEEAVRRDPRAHRAFWDPVGLRVAQGGADVPVLTDFGANVIDSLFTWARDSRVGQFFARKENRVAADVVVPFVASPQALGDALSIGRSLMQGDIFPVRRIVFVRNEVQGEFGRFARDPQMREIEAIAGEVGSDIVTLPLCSSGLLRAFEKQDVPKERLLHMSVDDVAKEFGLNFFEANREWEDARAWLERAREDLWTAIAPADTASPVAFE